MANLSTLQNYSKQIKNPHSENDLNPIWLSNVRNQATENLLKLGFPTERRGNEEWKYTNINPLINQEFNFASPQSNFDQEKIITSTSWLPNATNLVIVNGNFIPEISDKITNDGAISIQTIQSAIKSKNPAVIDHLSKHAGTGLGLSTTDSKPSESHTYSPFTALNTACIQQGLMVEVKPNHSEEIPINLIFVSTNESEPFLTQPRLLLIVGENSHSTIIESFCSLADNNYFTNYVSEIILNRKSRLNHYKLINESLNAFHVASQVTNLQSDSQLNSTTLERTVSLGRNEVLVQLDGENSSCNLNGLYTTSGSQHMDNFINIDHLKPHTTSRLSYKGILSGNSRAVFGGTVYVQPGAIKTDSLQSDKNLLLSPDAEVDSKPALFIYADDVKCGHGATAGNIDKDTLFYLRSRGIDLETASKLLIYGFAREIIDSIEFKPLHELVEKLFLNSIPDYKFEF
tara:strand:+ start:541 stop:1917 length:1377 start_codon:yes stop_codon:yes gene_type:complete